MSPRHACTPAPRISDPLGLAMAWLWAVGTAITFVCLGVLAGNGAEFQDASGPAPTAPDSAPAAA